MIDKTSFSITSRNRKAQNYLTYFLIWKTLPTFRENVHSFVIIKEKNSEILMSAYSTLFDNNKSDKRNGLMYMLIFFIL